MKKHHNIIYNILYLINITLLIIILSGCAEIHSSNDLISKDPFENFNRKVFNFNETVDSIILCPIAKIYSNKLPQPLQTSIINFFNNANDVSIAANKFLQGNISAGAETIMRIVINTIFGMGGLFDIATQAKLPKYHTNFSVTLSYYGIPSGPYLILPFLGPSTVRDSIVSIYANKILSPISYMDLGSFKTFLSVIHIISLRASLLNTTNLLSNTVLDKYIFLRSIYFQRTKFLIKNSQSNLLKYK